MRAFIEAGKLAAYQLRDFDAVVKRYRKKMRKAHRKTETQADIDRAHFNHVRKLAHRKAKP